MLTLVALCSISKRADKKKYPNHPSYPCGFTITNVTDVQYSVQEKCVYINGNKKICRFDGFINYTILAYLDLNLNNLPVVDEHTYEDHWLQFGIARTKPLFVIVEIIKNEEKGPKRYKNIMKLRYGQNADEYNNDQIFYSPNYIDNIRFIWEGTYIAFVSYFDITLYSVQHKFFLKIPNGWSGYVRILPVFEPTIMQSQPVYKEKKYELLLGRGEPIQYGHYEFPALRELDNVLYDKKLIKNKKKIFYKYAEMPSYFAYLLRPEKKSIPNFVDSALF